MDLGTLSSELASNPLAQLAAAVLSLAGGWRMWRAQSGSDAKERANSEGQMAALESWKELLAIERAAKVRAEERADEATERAEAFSEERNKALEAVWEMRGQLRAMSETVKTLNETVNRQNEELIRLRNQIRELEGKINGPHS